MPLPQSESSFAISTYFHTIHSFKYFRQEEDLYAYCSFLISIQRECEQYWNDQLDKPYDVRGSFTVVTTGCRGFADYVVRDLSLRRVSTLGTQAIHAMHIIPVKCTINVHLSLAMFLHPCSPQTDPSV